MKEDSVRKSLSKDCLGRVRRVPYEDRKSNDVNVGNQKQELDGGGGVIRLFREEVTTGKAGP